MDCCWVGCGRLERQSGTRFALPARHRKAMSSCYRLRAHLCTFGSRLRLQNSHVSAEQSVTKAKRLPATYCPKYLMVYTAAIYYRSVEPRRQGYLCEVVFPFQPVEIVRRSPSPPPWATSCLLRARQSMRNRRLTRVTPRPLQGHG